MQKVDKCSTDDGSSMLLLLLLLLNAVAAAAADAGRAKNSIELVTQSKGWGGFDGDESNLFLGDLIFDI